MTAIAKGNPGMTAFNVNVGSAAAGDIVPLLSPKYEMWDMGFSSLYMDLNDPNKKVIPLEQTPMFKEAVTLAKKWYDNGVISKNALADKENKPFETGKAFSGKSIYESLYETTTFTDKSAVQGAVEVYPSKKSARDSQMNNAMAINKNAANPERMLIFMNMLTTDKDVSICSSTVLRIKRIRWMRMVLSDLRRAKTLLSRCGKTGTTGASTEMRSLDRQRLEVQMRSKKRQNL